MKIVDILTKSVEFQRKKVFKIAFGAGSDVSRRIYVKILTDEGVYGLGEATPAPLVTGETLGGVVETIEFLKPALLGADPRDMITMSPKPGYGFDEYEF